MRYKLNKFNFEILKFQNFSLKEVFHLFISFIKSIRCHFKSNSTKFSKFSIKQFLLFLKKKKKISFKNLKNLNFVTLLQLRKILNFVLHFYNKKQ